MLIVSVIMLSVTIKSLTLNVTMLSVVLLNVVMPYRPFYHSHLYDGSKKASVFVNEVVWHLEDTTLPK